MRLLQFSTKSSTVPPLFSKRLVLRRANLDDYVNWSALREANAAFLQPWEPKWAWNELTRTSFRERLRQQEADFNSGRGVHFLIARPEHSKQILGGISLSNIRRNVSQTGTLGYWLGEEFGGNRYMPEAVATLAEHAFTKLSLHRIEAATVLDNERSQRVLEKCGFERNGMAREYLKIDGKWRDHHLFSLLNSSNFTA